MNLDEVAARLAIQDLIAKYVRWADTGRAEEQSLLFTEDGVLGEHRGRAAIRDYLDHLKVEFATHPVDGSGGVRHHVSSINIDIVGPDEARATSYFLVLRAQGLDHWGIYRDRFVRVGGRWLFAERQPGVGGSVPGSVVPGPGA